MKRCFYSAGMIFDLPYTFSQTPDSLQELEAAITLEITDTIDNDTDTMLIDSGESISVMPQLIDFIKADYPAELVRKGVSGSVVLDLLVNESGDVDSVSIAKGIHPVLDTNALRAAQKFRFTPAMAGEDSIAVLLQYEYHFTLEDAVDSIPQVSNFTGTLLEKVHVNH